MSMPLPCCDDNKKTFSLETAFSNHWFWFLTLRQYSQRPLGYTCQTSWLDRQTNNFVVKLDSTLQTKTSIVISYDNMRAFHQWSQGHIVCNAWETLFINMLTFSYIYVVMQGGIYQVKISFGFGRLIGLCSAWAICVCFLLRVQYMFSKIIYFYLSSKTMIGKFLLALGI